MNAIARTFIAIALAAPVRRHPPAPGKLTLESRVARFLAHPVTGPLFARAADGAIELGYDEWGGTTGAGLGNEWHLGYSNAVSVSNIL